MKNHLPYCFKNVINLRDSIKVFADIRNFSIINRQVTIFRISVVGNLCLLRAKINASVIYFLYKLLF